MQGQDFTVHRTYVKYMYLQEIKANSARTCQSRARIGDYGKIIVVCALHDKFKKSNNFSSQGQNKNITI